MSGNTLGKLFCVTSFGESHGPAIGCVVDGCPPGMALTDSDIQRDLDRRRPGTSRHVTQRQESDTVENLSGVFEGRTDGTPNDFLNQWRGVTPKIPVFGITFGDAEKSQLNTLANDTSGRVFDGTADLAGAFRAARGYN